MANRTRKTDPKTAPKISVKIWEPIIKKLDTKIRSACLRRDAYLNKILEVELDWLDDEVSLPNSQESYDFVFDRLQELKLKLVSLALSPELTDRLNEICSRKRIVRDAFFNRIFLLLAASPRVIDSLFFNNVRDEWRMRVWKECKDNEAFLTDLYPLEPQIAPFWAIRTGIAIYSDDQALEDYVEPTSGKAIRVKRETSGSVAPADSLYTTICNLQIGNENLLGLSCYMPDWRIPGHEAEQKRRANLDDLLADLAPMS